MLYEMKFEIDEPQFTQREILGVIDLPATTVNTWIKRNLLDAFEFTRDFRDDKDRLLGLTADSDRIRVYKVFQHDSSVRRTRLYSVLDALCLAGMKAVLDANIEIRFAYQFPSLLCDHWTDQQLWNMGRQSLSEEPLILYVDNGQLLLLMPPTPYRRTFVENEDPGLRANAETVIGPNLHRVKTRDLTETMRDAQLTSVTVIDWPAVEERVIDKLKRVIDVRGHRSWDAAESAA